MVQEWEYLGTDGSGPATGEARPVLPTAHTLRPERAQHQGLVGLGPAVGVPLPASPRWHPCWGLLSGNQLRGSIAGWGLSSALPVTAFPTSPLVLATRAIVLPVPGMGGWAPSARPPESWSSPSYLGWGTTLELPRKVCLQVWGPQARALTPACAPRTGLLGGSCPPGGWRNGAQWVPGLGPSS